MINRHSQRITFRVCGLARARGAAFRSELTDFGAYPLQLVHSTANKNEAIPLLR